MKKIKTIFLIVILSCIFMSLPTDSLAVVEDSVKTNTTIFFEENSLPTDPVIPPVNPTDPTDPNGPDEPTGNIGTLRIDLVPNFHFGEFTLGTGMIEAKNTRKNSNLQITDGRGTLAGWTVSVSKTEFVNKEHILSSVLTLIPGDVKNDAAQAVTLDKNVTAPIEVNTSAQPIFSAGLEEGGGTYLQNFDNEKATLKFNTNFAKRGMYTSELTWTLVTAVDEGAR